MIDSQKANPAVTAIILIVAAAALAIATATLQAYFNDPESLWINAHHDRNGHFAAGQQFAIALRSLDFIAFADGILRSTVWPPLYYLGLGFVLLVGGISYKLAVIPGLVAWMALMVMVAILASKALTDSQQSLIAAIAASALALTSPAFRLIAADVMIEAPGAAISAICLYQFGRAASDPYDQARWRLLGIFLTLLFFTKYNYWMICVTALALTGATLIPLSKATLERAIQSAKACLFFAWQTIRKPLGIVGLLVFAVAVAVLVNGPKPFFAFGHPVNIYPPNNIISISLTIFAISFAITQKNNRNIAEKSFDPFVKNLAKWHVLPIAIWMLLPDRIASFVWFLSPANSLSGSIDLSNIYNDIVTYWLFFDGGFLPGSGTGWLVAGCLLAALLGIRRLTVTGRVVLALAVISAILVAIHPNRQPRYLAHWQFAVWIGAGIGFALISHAIFGLYFARTRIIATGLLAVVYCVFALSWPVSEVERTAAHRPPDGLPSDLVISRSYLEKIDPGRIHAVVASYGRTSLPVWTTRESCRCLTKVAQPWLSHDGSNDDRVLSSFLAETTVDTLVVVAVSDYLEPVSSITAPRSALIAKAMAAQQRFELHEELSFASHETVVSIWRKPETQMK